MNNIVYILCSMYIMYVFVTAIQALLLDVVPSLRLIWTDEDMTMYLLLLYKPILFCPLNLNHKHFHDGSQLKYNDAQLTKYRDGPIKFGSFLCTKNLDTIAPCCNS